MLVFKTVSVMIVVCIIYGLVSLALILIVLRAISYLEINGYVYKLWDC